MYMYMCGTSVLEKLPVQWCTRVHVVACSSAMEFITEFSLTLQCSDRVHASLHSSAMAELHSECMHSMPCLNCTVNACLSLQERKKLRRQWRREAEREKQEQIQFGLVDKPEPKGECHS